MSAVALDVHEIMSRRLFAVKPSASCVEVLADVLALGITAAAVVDDDGRPLGVASLRDLVGAGPEVAVRERMTAPALTVSSHASVFDAARRLAETDVHRLLAVDGQERVVGVVSAVDLVRALAGIPVRHPESLPAIDYATGLSWSQDAALEESRVATVPDRPGLFVLVEGGVGRAEVELWFEETEDLRARVGALARGGSQEPPRLAAILERAAGRLRFRLAVCADAEERGRALRRLRGVFLARADAG